MLLRLFRELNIEQVSLEEMVSASAIARLIVAEFEANKIPVPEWITLKQRAVKRAVDVALVDSREKEILELQLTLEKLKTPTERRALVEARLAELTGKTNPTPASV